MTFDRNYVRHPHHTPLPHPEHQPPEHLRCLYRTQMINTHQTVVPFFETEAAMGRDAALKGFAAQWVPTIRHHLGMAEAMPPVR